MYQNRISLMGFTGKDAETRTTKNQKSYAVLSLATKSSYKDIQKFTCRPKSGTSLLR